MNLLRDSSTDFMFFTSRDRLKNTYSRFFRLLQLLQIITLQVFPP